MNAKLISWMFSILYILSLALFSFFLYSTRINPRIIIDLTPANLQKTTGSNNTEYLNIHRSDYENLANLIRETKHSQSESNLIQIFEREREHYILLTSLLFGLTAIISIYFAASRFIEQNEYEKLKVDLMNLDTKLSIELRAARKNTLVSRIANKTFQLNNNTGLIFNNMVVTTFDDFLLYIENDIALLSRRVLEFIPEFESDFTFYIANYIGSLLQYGRSKFNLSEVDWNVDSSRIFSTAIRSFHASCNPEEYKIIIKILRDSRPHEIVLGKLEPL